MAHSSAFRVVLLAVVGHVEQEVLSSMVPPCSGCAARVRAMRAISATPRLVTSCEHLVELGALAVAEAVAAEHLLAGVEVDEARVLQRPVVGAGAERDDRDVGEAGQQRGGGDVGLQAQLLERVVRRG